MRSHRLEIMVCLFLIVSTLAVYWQVRNHDFVNLDDDVYVTLNPYVRGGFSGENAIWAFTKIHAGNWHPLTWLSHMLDCELFGLKAGMHHLTNLLFHIANSILLFFVFRRMTGAIWQSAFVAALFALHPLHVESVAWVAERKDVLSTFFWMLTLWAYVRYTERPGVNRYIWVVILFALGLMAKPMVVTLPFVLLLMDFWPLGRMKLGSAVKGNGVSLKKSFDFGLIWEKIPLFVLVLFSCVMTFLSEDQGGSMASMDTVPMKLRFSNSLISYVRYMGKMAWPNDLAVFYPLPDAILMWKTIGAGLLFIFISITAICFSRHRPYLAVGWLWYIGTLVPVIGLVQVGAQSMADRYTYIPLVGLFVMIAWGVPEVLRRWRYERVILAVSTGLLLLILMVCSWLQIGHWKDGISLFKYSIKAGVNHYVVHNNLGNALFRQGSRAEAIAHYLEALRRNPDCVKAHYNLANALVEQGKIEEAINHYLEALRIDYNNEEAHNNLGNALAKQGLHEDAITHYSEALKINPAYGEAHYNLGVSRAEQGRFDEAVRHYSDALRSNPDDVKTHNNLANALAQQGRFDKAIGHFGEALRIKPGDAKTHNNLANALAEQGRFNESIRHYSEAVRLSPKDVNTRTNFGSVLAHNGFIEAAVEQYTEALKINPELAEVRVSLGVLLARHGHLDDAIDHFEAALRIKPDFAAARRNLARTLKKRASLGGVAE